MPPQQTQLIRAAPNQSAIALSFNIFALNAGIAIGSALGGVILSGRHTDALPYAGAIFTAVALLAAVGVERRARLARQREERRPAEEGAVPDEAASP